MSANVPKRRRLGEGRTAAPASCVPMDAASPGRVVQGQEARRGASCLCVRCGAFPQNPRKAVKAGLCCNRCPHHGPWCTKHAVKEVLPSHDGRRATVAPPAPSLVGALAAASGSTSAEALRSACDVQTGPDSQEMREVATPAHNSSSCEVGDADVRLPPSAPHRRVSRLSRLLRRRSSTHRGGRSAPGQASISTLASLTLGPSKPAAVVAVALPRHRAWLPTTSVLGDARLPSGWSALLVQHLGGASCGRPLAGASRATLWCLLRDAQQLTAESRPTARALATRTGAWQPTDQLALEQAQAITGMLAALVALEPLCRRLSYEKVAPPPALGPPWAPRRSSRESRLQRHTVLAQASGELDLARLRRVDCLLDRLARRARNYPRNSAAVP
jgi:hypothetical protein